MSKVRRWWIGIVGGVALAAAIGGGAVMAQTSSPTTPVPSATVQQGNSSGTQFKSNEDPTHEAAESAQQEAAENSGQAFHGGNCPHGQGQDQGSQTPGATQTPNS